MSAYKIESAKEKEKLEIAAETKLEDISQLNNIQ